MVLQNDITALWITLRLAFITVLILLALGTPLAWWLANTKFRFKALVEAAVALPLVLPPTVIGFYMLVAIGPNGPIGEFMDAIGAQPLAFSFAGLVLGSVFYSLPFVVQPLQSAFSSLGKAPLEIAATLGAGPLDRFFTIVAPLTKSGYLTATVLGFAHTMGEFGVVLMIGGNIPGRTQVLSIAIYDHVEALDYTNAHWLSAALLVFSFVLLLGVYGLNRRFDVVKV